MSLFFSPPFIWKCETSLQVHQLLIINRRELEHGTSQAVTSIKNIGLPFLTKEVEAEKNNEVKYTMK